MTVQGDFPYVTFGKEKRGHVYAEGTIRLDVDGIDQLNVQVDLARHKVVGIDPTGTDVHARSYTLVNGPTPAGPPDPATCPKGD